MEQWRIGYEAKTVATLVSNFVLPALMSAISLRRYLLWGLLPPIMLGLSAIGIHLVQHDFLTVRRDFIIIPAYILLSVLFISGPVSLVRFLMARSRRRRAAAQVDFQLQREAASLPQQGVWPPPPDYKP